MKKMLEAILSLEAAQEEVAAALREVAAQVDALSRQREYDAARQRGLDYLLKVDRDDLPSRPEEFSRTRLPVIPPEYRLGGRRRQ